MAGTTTANLTNSIQTRYSKQYLEFALQQKGEWSRFIDKWESIPEKAGHGSTFQYPVYGDNSTPVDTALDETSDVTPDHITDDYISFSPAEYGKTWSWTKLAQYKSMVDPAVITAKVAAKNRVLSIDKLYRRIACGHGSTRPTQTYHIDGSTLMTSLTANSGTDVITWAFLEELQMRAMAADMEPFDGAGYVVLAHPLLMYDVKNLAQHVNQYNPNSDARYQSALGESIRLGGFTFIPSMMGKVFLGAGTSITATTLDGAHNAGATTVNVASGTGITAGDYVTIGTLETNSVAPGNNLEQVLVTAVDTNALTIRGNGVGNGFGLRYDHAASEAVTESYNVAAVPVIGKNSLMGAYGSDTGQYGKPVVTENLDTLHRITYLGWYWYGGVGIVQKRIILGKVAVSKWVTGVN